MSKVYQEYIYTILGKGLPNKGVWSKVDQMCSQICRRMASEVHLIWGTIKAFNRSDAMQWGIMP